MDRGLALVLTLLVGGLVALQPPANALMSREVGSLGATLVSLLISISIIGVLLVAFGDLGQLRNITGFKPGWALGGIGGAAVVLITLVAVKPLGAAGVTAALVATQLTVSAIADRFGWLGLEREPFSTARIAGVLLLIAGTFLVTSR